jgi:hypothetical protein
MEYKFDEFGNFEGEMPLDVVTDCAAPGNRDETIEYWQEKLNFNAPRELAVAYLLGFGAWDSQELAAKSDVEISRIVLWLACCEIKEQGAWYGLQF